LKIRWPELNLNELVGWQVSDSPTVAKRAVTELVTRISALPENDRDRKMVLSKSAVVHSHSRMLLSLAGPRQIPIQREIASVRGLLDTYRRLEKDVGREPISHWLDPDYPDSVSVCVALQTVGLWRDKSALPRVLPLLHGETPMVRRFAAEAVGRIGDKTAVPELLKAVANVTLPRPRPSDQPPETDRALEHAIIYALIEIADPVGTARGMASESPQVQRAALIALDQMPGGGVKPDQVLVRLDSAEPLLKETANWLVSRHPEWGGEIAGWFAGQLAGIQAENGGDELELLLVRHSGHPAIRELLANSLLNEALTAAARRLALRVMARAKPSELPGAWGDALAQLVADPNSELARQAVLTARDLPHGKKPHGPLNEALVKIAADPLAEPATRLNALAAVHGGIPHVSPELFDLLIASVSSDRPVEKRSAAAEGLGKTVLNAEQLTRLAEVTKTVGPLELDHLLAPFERSTDEQVGLLLLDALKKASSLSSLRIDSLQAKLAKYSPAVQQRIPEVVALVNVDAAAQKKELEERLAKLSGGDVRRGQAVFNSAKAACTACHRFGYLGGTSGPDMTRIGGIRTERDLLESILFPRLSFVRSYEPVIVVTTDGRVVNGLIRNETSAELLITTGPNQEVRIPRGEVEETRPSTVSVMPAGLDKQLTDQEMADLVAFLKNAK
jgi:putative heme-binding domain-containing protein